MTLPDDIRERIDADHDETLLEPIAEILYDRRDRPYYQKRHLKNRLRERYNQDPSTKTIGGRLDTLMTDEFVARDRVGGTDIFYWADDSSDWPIPPDVEVEPERVEPTVSEWANRPYVSVGIAALAFIILGSIATFIALFNAAGVVDMPLPVSASYLFGAAFWGNVTSYVLLLVSAVIALRQRGAIPAVRLE